MRTRSPLPSDRAQLIDIISQGAGFRPEEVACAIELLDAALAPAERRTPTRRCVAVDDEPGAPRALLGYACFGATPMTEATYDLYWLVVAAGARGRGIGAALLDGRRRGAERSAARGIIRVETSSLEGQGGARALLREGRLPAGRARSPTSTAHGDDLLMFAKVL